MDDLGVLQWLALGFATIGMGSVIWGLLSGRIRARGYRGIVALTAAILVPLILTRSVLGDRDSFMELMVALLIAIGWGEFTVPRRTPLRVNTPRSDT